MANPRFCSDCRHCSLPIRQKTDFPFLSVEKKFCLHPQYLDLITGKPVFTPKEGREFGRLCGPSAKLFSSLSEAQGRASHSRPNPLPHLFSILLSPPKDSLQ